MSECRSMCVNCSKRIIEREREGGRGRGREGEGEGGREKGREREGEEEEGRREERECVTLVGDQLWHALSLRNVKNLIQCTLASNLMIL